MIWSNNEQWMLTGDHNGFVKYWQSNMNNVKVYQAHNDPVRGLTYVEITFLIDKRLEFVFLI
jgi:polyadenylation factor subunit 2